ncbi:MAG TPA: type II toxin-antitoxin system HicB family antitoxin [Tepidisphaeraceae bacterium]|nr:type II toxin-antitoxin system HicB family antitoxin [Tepidisphaeraceae bacterium]
MRILHVNVTPDEGWLVAQALEEPGVITQGRTFDELIANVRNAAELLLEDKDIHIELVIPASVRLSRPKSGRRAKPATRGSRQPVRQK